MFVAFDQMRPETEQAIAIKQQGRAFLEINKTKEGVVTLPSGLQYKIIRKGSGRKPKLTDQVKANYRGTLINGSEFDSSAGQSTPPVFAVNDVIAGWQEALQQMRVGAKWELFVPSDLAYGRRGYPPHIGPHETLIFQVELLSIE